jgi:Glycosyl hydrolase family 9
MNPRRESGALPLSHLAHCQLGYRPASPKRLTLVPDPTAGAALPERIPFYLRALFDRIPRDAVPPAAWNARFFRWPFDLDRGALQPERGRIAFQGELARTESRWGVVWQGDFTAFDREGNWQIETDHCSTYPIAIKASLYDRLQRGYLHYLSCQRSGCEVPGIRRAQHLDDGVLDTSGEAIDATGGWYDAGDLRKWLFLTLPNLAALAAITRQGHPGLRASAIEEIRWGNRYFHAMMAPDGQLWEDLAGGTFKAGLDFERDWWFENHPGCNADNAGGRYTDNIPGSGDERTIRTSYNPAVQFLFVRTQCQVAGLLEPAETARSLALAAQAWRHGRARGHDRRTLFVAEELWAALEAHAAGLDGVTAGDIRLLAVELLERQDRGTGGLSGYFMEKGGDDAFRCIALSCEPALALVRLVELAPAGLTDLCERAATAVTDYVQRYVLADAASNPFGIGPYGVYVHPPSPELQLFREAGRGRGVRTFIHPFNPQQIVHGTGGVVAHQAALCAKAGRLLQRPEWGAAAERMLQWLLGHNPQGLCLHTGVGYRHPTPYSAYVTQIPDAICVGHIGRPDDTPYQETSPLIEWSTQEIWDIPHAHMTEAVLWL